MPNWCSTEISIRASKESLDKLEKEIEKATSINPPRADFGEKWLGNLLLHIGVPEDEILHGKPRCRGALYYVNRLHDKELYLETETAWSPNVKCIDMFAKHFDAAAEVTYSATENGCCLYWTNDPDQTDMVDGDWSDDIPEDMKELLQASCGAPLESVMLELKDYCGKECATLSEYAQQLQQMAGEDYYVNLWTYDYVPIEETE